MNRRTETQSVETDADPADVLAVLADPQRIPAWAPAFADTVTGDAQSGWRAMKDDRQFNLRVVAQHDAGTVDYFRQVAPGREGGACIRVLPRPGGGAVIVMTVPLLPDIDPPTAMSPGSTVPRARRVHAPRYVPRQTSPPRSTTSSLTSPTC